MHCSLYHNSKNVESYMAAVMLEKKRGRFIKNNNRLTR